jgi:hypothetical protein
MQVSHRIDIGNRHPATALLVEPCGQGRIVRIRGDHVSVETVGAS